MNQLDEDSFRVAQLACLISIRNAVRGWTGKPSSFIHEAADLLEESYTVVAERRWKLKQEAPDSGDAV